MHKPCPPACPTSLFLGNGFSPRNWEGGKAGGQDLCKKAANKREPHDQVQACLRQANVLDRCEDITVVFMRSESRAHHSICHRPCKEFIQIRNDLMESLVEHAVPLVL